MPKRRKGRLFLIKCISHAEPRNSPGRYLPVRRAMPTGDSIDNSSWCTAAKQRWVRSNRYRQRRQWNLRPEGLVRWSSKFRLESRVLIRATSLTSPCRMELVGLRCWAVIAPPATAKCWTCPTHKWSRNPRGLSTRHSTRRYYGHPPASGGRGRSSADT